MTPEQSPSDRPNPPPAFREICAVNPARLQFERGDITESYSADRISEGKPLRAPFEFSGSLWVCVSITGKGLTVTGEHELKAYRLLPEQLFKGTPTTYSAKVADAEAARNDPNGFYDSVPVRYAGKVWIMSGPPAVFVAEAQPVRPEGVVGGEPVQLSLFL